MLLGRNNPNYKNLGTRYNKINSNKINEFSFAGGDRVCHGGLSFSGNQSGRPCGIRDVYPTGFHNLPVRVLLNIFKYFDETELRKSIMPVCRKWKRVTQLPELWQRLKFTGNRIPSDYMCNQIRVHCYLQSVHLFKVPDVVPVIRQLCRCVPGITSVGIKDCSNSQPDGRLPESVLRNLVASCKRLKEIDLKGTQFIGNMFYLEVGILPELRSINLSKNKYVNGKNLIELVLNCRALEELKLTHRFDNQKLSDSDILYLFLNLKKTIRTLSFDGIGLPDTSYKIIPDFKNLERLVLYNTMNMSTETFLEFAKNLTNLKCLKIQRLTVPSNTYEAFFKIGAANLQQLTVVNFADCWKFDSNGLKALCRCCKNLEKLNLKNCNGVTTLQPLYDSKKLHLINLAFCSKIEDHDLISLTKKLPSLRKLLIDDKEERRGDLLKKIKSVVTNLSIVVCLSEFNKTCYEYSVKC